jgi:pyruvate dehydrogenase E2 component (dihydrolipoamide acetyltransferase)
MRQAIAGAMAQSKREIPHFYLGATVDMQRALAWLTEENARRSIEARLLPAVLLIKAVALALRDVPAMNGFWNDDAFRPGRGIHPGVAIALRGGGLVAPAIHDADQKDLSALMDALKDLVARARSGGLRSSELTDATITVTNLGEQGVEVGYGIIYPPQVALVSFGRVVERPMVVDGQVVARPVVQTTISADHRAVDGHLAGLFLAAIGKHLQDPLDCDRGKPFDVAQGKPEQL